jgi:hypothetical protein
MQALATKIRLLTIAPVEEPQVLERKGFFNARKAAGASLLGGPRA